MSSHQTTEHIAQEQSWIEKAKKDPRQFHTLYDKYFDDIFHFIFRRTHDEALTADLVSQTFLKALDNLKKYQHRGLPFSAWLYRIASNEVNKYFRESKKMNTFSLEEPVIHQFMEMEADDFTEERLVVLKKHLAELSTEELSVLQLRFFEEKSFKEIAYILNISESGAKMRTYRTLEKLKKYFQG